MRPTWDETWLAVADAVSQRSRCVRKYGAVVVDESNRIIATGYNGPPAGYQATTPLGGWPAEVAWSCVPICPHASLEPGEDKAYLSCIAIHAEANALLFCDRRDRLGGTIYTTGFPCYDCAKLIANSGLNRVITRLHGAEWRDHLAVQVLLEASALEVEALS